MIHCTAARRVTAVLAATVLAAAAWLAPPAVGAAADATEEMAEAADGPVRVSDVRGLSEALRDAGPGTVIELAPGTYRRALHTSDVRGAPGRPVVVRSAEADRPAVFEGVGVQFSDPAHLVIENVVVRNAPHNGLNIDDGGSRETPAHHVVLRGVVVEGTGPDGNKDGIKLSGVDDLLVERCTVRGWGGGGGSGIDMVGCHRALFYDCRLQGRSGTPSNGIQAKGGSSEVVVRRCRLIDAGGRAIQFGGSTGIPYFRPPDAKYENRRSVALGNVIIGASAAVSFVGTEDSAFLYNTVVRPRRWVLRILQEQRAEGYLRCRDNTFAHNLAVWREGDVRSHVNVGPDTHPETFTFAENLWYEVDGSAGRSRPRLPAKETGGVYGKDPGLADLARPGPPDEAYAAFGHTAEGEAEAWRTRARPLVKWAAGQVREGGEAK
ncbi:MAG: right-handed parallel beta-helix repeat-containing protein [Phycisphaerae bacterium]